MNGDETYPWPPQVGQTVIWIRYPYDLPPIRGKVVEHLTGAVRLQITEPERMQSVVVVQIEDIRPADYRAGCEARRTWSEADKPKRKFWQLHLSTAVVLMILAGGLLGIICHCYFKYLPRRELIHGESEYLQGLIEHYVELALGIIGSIALLAVTAIVSESLIRRHEARKT
jgi:hypothetical protein